MGALNEPVISNIDKNGNVYYRGHDLQCLSGHALFEEVAYLLLFGSLPNPDQLKRFSDDLARFREIPDRLLDAFDCIPKSVDMTDFMPMAVSILGKFDPELHDHSSEAVIRKAVRMIAGFPTAIAARYRMIHNQEPLTPSPRFSYSRNLFYTISGYGPDEEAVNALDSILILYAEYDTYNQGCQPACAASPPTDYYASLIGAIRASRGNGSEASTSLRMLMEIEQRGNAESWIRKAIAENVCIAGFNGRGRSDSSARVIKSLSKNLAEKLEDTRWNNRCRELEEIMCRVKTLQSTVDLYAGPVLSMLGVPVELFTPMLIVGRIAGWSAHIIEHFKKNCNMKDSGKCCERKSAPTRKVTKRSSAP